MIFTAYQHAADFLMKTQAVLEKDETANSLLLGIGLSLKKFAERIQTPPYLATVEDEQGLVAAFCMTPPHNIILYSNQTNDVGAFTAVIQDLLAHNWPVKGAIGPTQVAHTFATTWSRLTGQPYREGIRERVFELSQVIPPPPAPGAMRVATEHDLELVTRWFVAFYEEALHENHTAMAEQEAKRKVDDGDIYVWELADSTVVTLAGKTRPISRVISVGPVYTPPEYRGKGYASNCVATLSQLLLDSGWQHCSLFTDLSNPISNSIYQKIGYRPVCDYNEYLFGE